MRHDSWVYFWKNIFVKIWNKYFSFRWALRSLRLVTPLKADKILLRPRTYKNPIVWWSHTRVSLEYSREFPFEFFVGMRPRRGLKLESCFGLCWLPDLVNDGACLRLDMWGSFVSELKPPNMRFLKKLRLLPYSPEFQKRPTNPIWNPGLWRLQWSYWGRKRRRSRRNPWRLRSRCRRFWPHLWVVTFTRLQNECNRIS